MRLGFRHGVGARRHIKAAVKFRTASNRMEHDVPRRILGIHRDIREPVEIPFRTEVRIGEGFRLLALPLIVAGREVNRRTKRRRITDRCVYNVETGNPRVGTVSRHAGMTVIGRRILVVWRPVGRGTAAAFRIRHFGAVA